jgi:hypothetical protein
MQVINWMINFPRFMLANLKRDIHPDSLSLIIILKTKTNTLLIGLSRIRLKMILISKMKIKKLRFLLKIKSIKLFQIFRIWIFSYLVFRTFSKGINRKFRKKLMI